MGSYLTLRAALGFPQLTLVFGAFIAVVITSEIQDNIPCLGHDLLGMGQEFGPWEMGKMLYSFPRAGFPIVAQWLKKKPD